MDVKESKLKTYRVVILVLCSLLVFTCILVPGVSAYDYVHQMDNVCVNQTIDISGVLGGYGQAAWYGRNDEYRNPPYLIEIPYYIRPLSRFYLDPKVFETRTGTWYKYTGNAGTEHGNMVAFYVQDCRETKSTSLLINDYYINSFYNFNEIKYLEELK